MKDINFKHIVSMTAFVTFLSTSTNAETKDSSFTLEASGTVANNYLWRGINLGDGDPMVAANLKASLNGFYAGMWTGSGDAAAGTEIDWYFGYGFNIKDGLRGSFQYLTATYPEIDQGFGDWGDYALNLGYGIFDYSVAVDAGNDTDTHGKWKYMTFSIDLGKYAILIGKHHDEYGSDGLLHTNLIYKYNNNLAFTLSIPLDVAEGDVEQDPTVHVAFNIPINFDNL